MKISHQWYVQLDSVLSVVLNDVPVNTCNDTYVSSSYVCLESAFCLRSYLVFPWEIRSIFPVRSVLSILTVSLYIVLVVQLYIVQSNQLRTSA